MTTAHEPYPDSHNDVYSKTVFGFWLYLLTDFMLFATIFAAYAVLQKSTFGGPTPREIFNLDYTLVQSLFLLGSAAAAGMGGAMAHRKQKGATVFYFLLTFILGAAFLWMMVGEFAHMTAHGLTWKTNAFLSTFYTLVGTHGAHMVFALLWIPVLLIPLMWEKEISPTSIKRITCLRMFWQFLNVMWIFIFNIVYLMGVI